jgi:hypothetical protein
MSAKEKGVVNPGAAAKVSVAAAVAGGASVAKPAVNVPVADSAMVIVSAATRLTNVAAIVSSLVNVGVSATVRLRSGNKETLKSAIASLNEKTEIVSAALTLRGAKPVG